MAKRAGSRTRSGRRPAAAEAIVPAVSRWDEADHPAASPAEAGTLGRDASTDTRRRRRAAAPRARVQLAHRSGADGLSRRRLVLGAVLAVAVLAAAAWFLGSGREGSGALAVLRTADFHALAYSGEDPSVVFFGHHDGVMRSTDGGKNWSPLVARRNFDAMGLAVARAGSAEMFLAGHDVFYSSRDGGVSWRPVEHDLPDTDIHGFVVSPDDPDRLYAYVVDHGLFQSADGARTWQRLDGRLPDDLHALAAAGGSPETLYAGSMHWGVLKSTDGGANWTPAVTGLGSRMVVTLAVDPLARQTVYAGADGGLYKTTTGGAAWSKLPFPGDNAMALAINPSNPQVILAITVKDDQGLLYRSENGGATWGRGQ